MKFLTFGTSLNKLTHPKDAATTKEDQSCSRWMLLIQPKGVQGLVSQWHDVSPPKEKLMGVVIIMIAIWKNYYDFYALIVVRISFCSAKGDVYKPFLDIFG